MRFVSSAVHLARWTGIFIGLIFGWPDSGVSQTSIVPLPSARLAAARSLVQEALLEAKSLKTDQDRGALRNLARAQAKTGDITGAQQTLAAVPDLPDTQNTIFVIREIAVAQAVAADMPSALRTAETLPEGPSRDVVLNAIVKAQALRGDVGGALQTAGSMKKDWQRSNMMLSVAEGQAEAGDLAGAIKTARAIPYTSDNFSKLAGFIAITLARNGKLAEALSTARTIRSGDRLLLYVSLAALWAKAGDLTGATQIAEEIPEDTPFGLREVGFYGVVLGKASTGDLAGARLAVKRIKDPWVQAMATGVIVGLQARRGDVGGALNTVQELPYHQQQAVASVSVAIGQARTGHMAGAIQTADSIDDGDQRSNALTKIAQTQADQGDGNGAWKTVGMISDTTMQNLAEEKVALILARAGDSGRLIAIGRRKSSAYSRVIGLSQSAEDILNDRADRADTGHIDNYFPPEVKP